MLFNERADFLFNNVAIKTTGYIVVVVASESDYKLNKIKWCEFNTAFFFSSVLWKLFTWILHNPAEKQSQAYRKLQVQWLIDDQINP